MNEVLTVRVSKEVKKRLEEEAKRMGGGVTISHIVRMKLERDLKQKEG